MHIAHQERPRELKWYHAGPMLYGDWGTSRLYVLGLAFYFALYSSFWYIVGVGILVAAVGWAYTVVCRIYPEGGGVYTAARQLSPLLSVIGALMLFANYAVTAALSAFDAMHYFGLEAGFAVKIGACACILILGVVNYIGPRHAGQLALWIAAATLLLTVILGIASIPHVPEGWRSIRPAEGTLTYRWSTLVSVVLALSGVEVIANMTGIMVKPVSRTSKQSIWPVLAEVVIFNILLGIAMLALPAALKHAGVTQPNEFTQPAVAYQENDQKIAHYRDDHKDWHDEGRAQYDAYVASLGPHSGPNEEAIKLKVLRVMGETFVSKPFGIICGIVFGLLLLSAVNTVIGGMMSVAYIMARDRELPTLFGRLNTFGVPWAGLIPALGVPIVLLMMFSTLETLADLYAMGVVGAIAINLTCCTINMNLPVKMWERLSIGVIAAVMIVMELTLAIQKPHALGFVLIILGVGLGGRFITRTYLPARAKARARPVPAAATPAEPVPATVTEEVPELTFGTPPEQLDMSRPHLMVATRGGQRLLTFAADYAKQLNAIVFVLYVRHWNVQFASAGSAPELQEDFEAQRVFRMAEEICKAKDVPMVPIYVVSRDVADSILDFAATYDVKALLMGVSRQGTIVRALRGDVLTAVADALPEDIPLLIHA